MRTAAQGRPGRAANVRALCQGALCDHSEGSFSNRRLSWIGRLYEARSRKQRRQQTGALWTDFQANGRPAIRTKSRDPGIRSYHVFRPMLIASQYALSSVCNMHRGSDRRSERCCRRRTTVPARIDAAASPLVLAANRHQVRQASRPALTIYSTVDSSARDRDRPPSKRRRHG